MGSGPVHLFVCQEYYNFKYLVEIVLMSVSSHISIGLDERLVCGRC